MSGNKSGPPRGGGYQGQGGRPLQPNSPVRSTSPAAGGAPPGGGQTDIARLLQPPPAPFPYFDANSKAPRAAMLDKEAEDVARKLASLPSSQLRRFYSAVMALRRRLERDRERKLPDDEIKAQLALLKAQAAYTWKRGRNYPEELVAFFTRHAAAVRTRDDFLRGFQPHFEAVMAYHKVYEIKKDQGA